VREYLANSRWSLHFSATDIFSITLNQLLFSPLKRLFTRCFLSKTPGGPHESAFSERKLAIFEKGTRKVMKELDCVSLLNRMKTLEQLMTLLLTSR
jgi:hypothetical protein